MTADLDLCYLPATEIAARIRVGELTATRVIENSLARIGAINPKLNCFCFVYPEEAMALASELDREAKAGKFRGPLHGVPFAIKDLTPTKGKRTTLGSYAYEHWVPDYDAPIVEALKAAGGIMVGKTTTPEFAYSGFTESPLWGITRNPWNPDRTAGGSSGGAGVAVASGCVPLAEGSDMGGSVRIPAAFCGLVGVKPSFGRVPQTPGFPGWEHVGAIGPLARTVRDAAAVLDVIAGGDDRDRHSLPREAGTYLEACDESIRGLHVAWTPDLGYAAVDERVLELCGDAAAEFEELGCHVEVVNPGWESPEEAFATIVSAQFYAAWGDALPAREADLDASLVRFIRRGGAVSARDYLTAMAKVNAYWQEVHVFLARFDLLLTPTTAVPPFPLGAGVPREIAGQEVSRLGWMPFTYPFNLTGQPAASVPAGWTEDGLPVGLQIVGRRHADRTVLAAAAAFEAARPWRDRRPVQ